MDPNIWGPQIWRLFNCVAHYADQQTQKGEIRHQEFVVQFFNIMSFLLPCKYCRLSYSKFLLEIPLVRKCNFTQWVWTMHEKVNDKLKKPPQCRLHFEQFQRRLNSYTTQLGFDDFFDICFILSINYEGSTSEPLKYKYLYQFFTILPVVLPHVELQYLFRNLISKDICVNRDSLINWVYKKILLFEKKHKLTNPKIHQVNQELHAEFPKTELKNIPQQARVKKIIEAYKCYYANKKNF